MKANKTQKKKHFIPFREGQRSQYLESEWIQSELPDGNAAGRKQQHTDEMRRPAGGGGCGSSSRGGGGGVQRSFGGGCAGP